MRRATWQIAAGIRVGFKIETSAMKECGCSSTNMPGSRHKLRGKDGTQSKSISTALNYPFLLRRKRHPEAPLLAAIDRPISDCCQPILGK